MAKHTSRDGTLYQDHESRIGTLETQVGQTPDPDDYTDKDDVRAITGYSDGDRVLCLENQYIYIFDDEEEDSDNGDDVLCPDDITPPDPGRWVRDTRLALYEHNHDTRYQLLIDTPTQNRFTQVNASGQLIETTYHANSWAAYTHNHDSDYADIDDFEDLETDVADLEADLEDKMDILSPTAGQVDEILTVNAQGQAQLSTKKIVDLSTKPYTITIPADDNGYDHSTGRSTEPFNIQVRNSDGKILGIPGQVDITVSFNETSGYWDINILNYTGDTLTDAKLSYV